MRIWIPVVVIALGVLAACIGALAHSDALIHLGGIIVGGGLGAAVPHSRGVAGRDRDTKETPIVGG